MASDVVVGTIHIGGGRYHVSDSERVVRIIYLTRRWTRVPSSGNLLDDDVRRLVPRKMPGCHFQDRRWIFLYERHPFSRETGFGYGTNILPLTNVEGASDKCGRRGREKEREGGRERGNRKRRPHIVRHEVPTDIHRHVYRKCNYSLKGSSILSDPSRSKWVLH